MAVTEQNRLRFRALMISRMVKHCFMTVPDIVPRRWWQRWLARLLWRWLFLDREGQVHRAGEILLADLRDFAGATESPFNPDPIIMARRVGRQEVVQRIFYLLNLDENTVRQLMELDDGLD